MEKPKRPSTQLLSRPMRLREENNYPNTELCVDLKLITQQPGRMTLGETLSGMLTLESENYYQFVESTVTRRQAPGERRSKRVYNGRYINVNQKPNGELRPAFNRLRYTTQLNFQQFCYKAARELEFVANLAEEQ